MTATPRTYASEFPDYPASDLPPMPTHWLDQSWRNDVSPFFVINPSAGVFVDFVDPAMREYPDGARFILVRLAKGQHVDEPTLCESDNWSEILAKVATI
jgi:hypothetical protein